MNFNNRVTPVIIFFLNKLSFIIPDVMYLKIQFRIRMGYSLDIKNPKTLSEKIQWLKINNRNPLYTSLVDKHLVKEHIASIVGDRYIIPTLNVWNTPEQIDWDTLPNRFVLKTTHGGGNNGVVICADKSTLDKKNTIKKLHRSLKQDIYNDFREWPYKNVQKKIIAEQFMSQPDGSPLLDYKFFCFNGVPRYIYVSQNIPGSKRSVSVFLNTKWEPQPFKKKHDTRTSICPQKPALLNQMIEIASKLAKDIPFVRVDLYEIGQQIYFSELTFYPSSGMQPYEPMEWDLILGEMLILPQPYK